MTRVQLGMLLKEVSGLTNTVYYQPPPTSKMSYPAIVYSRSDIRNVSADNDIYMQTHHYTVTVIDKNPDSPIVEAVSRIPKIRFNRHYTSENLNHDVFELYI